MTVRTLDINPLNAESCGQCVCLDRHKSKCHADGLWLTDDHLHTFPPERSPRSMLCKENERRWQQLAGLQNQSR